MSEKIKISESELKSLIKKVVIREYLNESTDMDRYEDVVFLQGDSADEAIEILKTQGEDAAMDYLIQWHEPGNHMGNNELNHGTSDNTYERDGYIMSYNIPLNYIGLQYENSGMNESKNRDKNKSKQKKFNKVMGEFGDGTLKTPNGDVVTDRKQALAIAYSESGLDESKQKLYNIVENIVRKTLSEDAPEFNFVLKVTKANGDIVEGGKYNNKEAAIKAKNMIDPKFKPIVEPLNKEKKLTSNSFSKISTKESYIKEGRPFQLGKGYTHFAIDKITGKIINGYDYKGYDPEDLKSDVRYYFLDDLADYFDFYEPKRSRKDVKIITRKKLEAAGVDIKDSNNWLKSSDNTPTDII